MTTQIEDLYKSDRKEIGHLNSTFMFIALFNLGEAVYNAITTNDTSLIILFYVAVLSFCFKFFYDRAKYQKPDATYLSMFLGANHLCLALLCLNTYLAVVSADLVVGVLDNLDNVTMMQYIETGGFIVATSIVYSLICHIEKKQDKK